MREALTPSAVLGLKGMRHVVDVVQHTRQVVEDSRRVLEVVEAMRSVAGVSSLKGGTRYGEGFNIHDFHAEEILRQFKRKLK
jgi:hypothetical protein